MAYCSSLRPDVRALPLDLAELTFEGIQWLSALPWHVSNCLLRGTVDLRKKKCLELSQFLATEAVVVPQEPRFSTGVCPDPYTSVDFQTGGHIAVNSENA